MLINNDVYQLRQPLQSRVIALMDDARVELRTLIIFETIRSEHRQAQLYGLGRNQPQMMWAYPLKPDYWCNAQPYATKVTWTTKSNHITGDACDFCFEVKGRKTWEGDWDKFDELAEKHGLKSLKPTERCHLEINPDFMPDVKTEQTIPDWATDSVKKAKAKNIITKDFLSKMPVYRFCVILDKLGLLK